MSRLWNLNIQKWACQTNISNGELTDESQLCVMWLMAGCHNVICWSRSARACVNTSKSCSDLIKAPYLVERCRSEPRVLVKIQQIIEFELKQASAAKVILRFVFSVYFSFSSWLMALPLYPAGLLITGTASSKETWTHKLQAWRKPPIINL